MSYESEARVRDYAVSGWGVVLAVLCGSQAALGQFDAVQNAQASVYASLYGGETHSDSDSGPDGMFLTKRNPDHREDRR